MLANVMQRTSPSLRGSKPVEMITRPDFTQPKICDSRQTSFSCEFLNAYSEDTAKAARELAVLRTMFL
jgi:hypothetical protein